MWKWSQAKTLPRSIVRVRSLRHTTRPQRLGFVRLPRNLKQTVDATKNERLLGRVPLLSECYAGLLAHASVYSVRWDRKSGARTEQSFGPELRTSFGIDLGLEVDDGAAAGVETADSNHDLVADLRCVAIGRDDKGYAAGKLEDGLRAVETVRRT